VSNGDSLRIIFYESRYWLRKNKEGGTAAEKTRVFGARRSNSEVWRALLERIIPQLYGMFLKSWPNPSLAEELVQKTVFDAVRGRNTFDEEKGSVEEWIFGIAATISGLK